MTDKWIDPCKECQLIESVDCDGEVPDGERCPIKDASVIEELEGWRATCQALSADVFHDDDIPPTPGIFSDNIRYVIKGLESDVETLKAARNELNRKLGLAYCDILEIGAGKRGEMPGPPLEGEDGINDQLSKLKKKLSVEIENHQITLDVLNGSSSHEYMDKFRTIDIDDYERRKVENENLKAEVERLETELNAKTEHLCGSDEPVTCCRCGQTRAAKNTFRPEIGKDESMCWLCAGKHYRGMDFLLGQEQSRVKELEIENLQMLQFLAEAKRSLGHALSIAEIDALSSDKE